MELINELKIEQVALEQIKPYKNNAKKHPQSQVDNVAESIKTLGWRQPIVLDKNGALVGGCICPGVKVSLDALTGKTALLPGIQLDQPKKAIGRNTIECMRSGIMLGNACMIDGMVERMEAELGYPAKVIATGGIARFITPMCKTQILYDKDLIVKGLAALYRENRR